MNQAHQQIKIENYISLCTEFKYKKNDEPQNYSTVTHKGDRKDMLPALQQESNPSTINTIQSHFFVYPN